MCNTTHTVPQSRSGQPFPGSEIRQAPRVPSKLGLREHTIASEHRSLHGTTMDIFMMCLVLLYRQVESRWEASSVCAQFSSYSHRGVINTHTRGR